MTPALSIVIPHRNYKDLLPRMLESILIQSLKDLEVIVVDDASDVSCADVIEAFVNKGLAVRLIESRERLYPKNARLLGVEHAKADIIAFADADDMLWGTEALERHVDMFRAGEADLLQFRCVDVDQEGRYVGPNPNRLVGDLLTGKDIFRAYVQNPVFPMWAHLYSRRAWIRLIPDLRPIPLEGMLEDLCMLAFYYYHAKTYISSMDIGYGYVRNRKRGFLSMVGKTLDCRVLLTHLPNYLYAQGEDEEVVEELRLYLLKILHLYAGRASIAWANDPEELSSLPDADVPVFLECVAESLAANVDKLHTIRQAIFSLPDRSSGKLKAGGL